jgi:hypothetical protein
MFELLPYIKQIAHKLQLIAELGYAPYFLTVHAFVREAKRRGILCQGRGSATDSCVCFVLGVTSTDPIRHELLFERFISGERRDHTVKPALVLRRPRVHVLERRDRPSRLHHRCARLRGDRLARFRKHRH